MLILGDAIEKGRIDLLRQAQARLEYRARRTGQRLMEDAFVVICLGVRIDHDEAGHGSPFYDMSPVDGTFQDAGCDWSKAHFSKCDRAGAHGPQSNDLPWRVARANGARLREVGGEIVILDGVLPAACGEVFTAVPFDAETFDGFHRYDIDCSYRASRAGIRLGVAGDLLVVHASRGADDAARQRYADCFCSEHKAGRTPPEPSSFFAASLESADQVRTFYALLAAFSR